MTEHRTALPVSPILSFSKRAANPFMGATIRRHEPVGENHRSDITNSKLIYWFRCSRFCCGHSLVETPILVDISRVGSGCSVGPAGGLLCTQAGSFWRAQIRGGSCRRGTRMPSGSRVGKIIDLRSSPTGSCLQRVSVPSFWQRVGTGE